MKTSRREFLGAVAASPILLGMQDKAGSKAPIMGSGAYTYEATHDWGVLPPQIKYGNTHGVVEDSQGHIYVHHTVHATSESADTVVVFDRTGKFVRSWGKEYPRRRARPVDPQGGARRVPLPDGQRGRSEAVAATRTAGGAREDDAGGRDRVEDRRAAGLRGLQARAGRRSAALQPDQRGDRAQWRHLRGRRLRLVLRESVHQQGRVHPVVRRTRVRAGKADGAARDLGRHARGQPDSGRGRSSQQPPAAIHDGRQARRLHHGLPAPRAFRRVQGSRRRPGSPGPCHAPRSGQRDGRAARRLQPADWTTRRCAASRGISSSRASSSARTVPASITTAISSSWSGSRSGG